MAVPLKNRLRLAFYALRGSELPKARRGAVPPISNEEVAEAKTFFPLAKFFIFGHARSGTTVLARLVRLHPEVHCNYQAHFFTRQPLLESLVDDPQVGDWLNRSSNRWNRGRDLSPVVLRAAADFILERDARLEGKRIVGDKSPSSLMDGEAVRSMSKVYPDGYLIAIVRDGRDVAISHRFQAFIDFPEQLSKEDLKIRADFIQNAASYISGNRSIFTRKALERAARGWMRNVSETNQLGKQLYENHYMSLRYEDLITHPWEEMQRVWDFLGASIPDQDLQDAVLEEMRQNPDSDWQQQKAKEIAQPLLKARHGTWRDLFTAEDLEIFHTIAGSSLQTWGYPLEQT
jgi:hypothetical protein